MVSKDILMQYIDLKQEEKEVKERISKTEGQIARLMSEGNVIDKVMGGDGGIQPFTIEGFPDREYSKKKTLLYARKATLSALQMEITETINKVEEFIASIEDSHIRRIIALRVVEGKSWVQVSQEMGGNTPDSVRMTFERYIKS